MNEKIGLTKNSRVASFVNQVLSDREKINYERASDTHRLSTNKNIRDILIDKAKPSNNHVRV